MVPSVPTTALACSKPMEPHIVRTNCCQNVNDFRDTFAQFSRWEEIIDLILKFMPLDY